MKNSEKPPKLYNYIYVVLEDDSKNKKKVHIVDSIDAMLKSCCKIFEKPNLRRFLNIDSQTIESPSEFVFGETYYVTEISADFVPIDQATTDLTETITEKYELFKVPENDIKNKLKKAKLEAKEKKELIIKTKIQKIEAIQVHEKEEAPARSSKFSVCSRASARSSRFSSRIVPEEQKSVDSMSDSTISEAIDDSMSISAVSQRLRSRFGSESGSVARSRIASVRAASMKSGMKDADGKAISAYASLNQLDSFGIATPPNFGIKGIDVPKDLENKESEQAQLWQKNVSEMIFFNREEETTFEPLNDGLAYDTLANHALLVGTDSIHHIIKVNIVGPPNSGVPSLMRSFAKLYTSQLVALGRWKSHFVFGFDAKEIAKLVKQPAKLYKKMLDLVLSAISAQNPSTLQYIPRIKKQMLSILDFEQPSKGLHPYHDVEVAARMFAETWRNDEALENWISCVLSMPSILSSAVGYENITVFVDNLADADVMIGPVPPFTEFTNKANFIEHVKYSLTRCNFVVSCNRFELLMPTDENGIDLTRGMDTISTCQTPQDMLEGETQPIMLRIANELNPVILDDNIHGGIPKFLDQWEKTQKALCKYERVKNAKKEVCYIQALEEAQKLADLVLCRTDGKKVSVQDIGRPSQQRVEEPNPSFSL